MGSTVLYTAHPIFGSESRKPGAPVATPMYNLEARES